MLSFFSEQVHTATLYLLFDLQRMLFSPMSFCGWISCTDIVSAVLFLFLIIHSHQLSLQIVFSVPTVSFLSLTALLLLSSSCFSIQWLICFTFLIILVLFFTSSSYFNTQNHHVEKCYVNFQMFLIYSLVLR